MPVAELIGVTLRLERAHEHIDALKHESRMFMMELPQPYAVAVDDEPVDGSYIVRGKILRPPPARLGILAVDAAHNLRAALDMLAWELALKGPNPPPNSDSRTAFPICTDAKAWESDRTKRMIERIEDDAVAVIYSFQPYNRPRPEAPRLHVVQSLDNWGKHKAIPELMSFYVSRLRVVSPSFEIIATNERGFSDGDEVARLRRVRPTSPDEKLRMEALCHVAFSRDGPGFGWPLDFLDNAYQTISNEIVPAFYRFFEITASS